MSWLRARLICLRRRHDLELMTADERYSVCSRCSKQVDNKIPYLDGEWRKVLAS